MKPNQNWLTDFTYIWTTKDWLYAASAKDLYSRRIVGCTEVVDGQPHAPARVVSNAL